MPTFRTIRDVLDFAIAREQESYYLYRDLAPMAKRREVRRMIGRLATDELQHSAHLNAIRAGKTGFSPDDEVGSLDIEENLDERSPHPGMSYADLLVFAMKKEKAAFRLYTNLASIATNEAVRSVLAKLAQEEAEHKLRLEIEYDWATF
jgi:rubrerythrin